MKSSSLRKVILNLKFTAKNFLFSGTTNYKRLHAVSKIDTFYFNTNRKLKGS